MKGKRTPSWWWSRLELAVAIGVILAIVLHYLTTPEFFTMFGPPPGLVDGLALVLAVVGLIWMIRILRGPKDKPLPWRYRDF
jgi:hypothetical protein